MSHSNGRFRNRPKNREEFAEYILRRLGSPAHEVEIACTQMDDIIDDTVETYNLWHHDGSFRTYRKIVIDRCMIEENKHIPNFNLEADASDTNTIYDINQGSFEGQVGLDASNDNYVSADGHDRTQYREFNTGILVPDDIVGVTRVFNINRGVNSADWMSGRYQFLLDVYNNVNQVGGRNGSHAASRQTTLTNMQSQLRYLEEMEHALSYAPAIRFSKSRGRIYLDTDWDKFQEGDFLVFECQQATDPDVYPDVWIDKFVRDYATALAKIQWGQNLIKYDGVQLPGGVTLNGSAILEEGKAERDDLWEKLQTAYMADITPILIG